MINDTPSHTIFKSGNLRGKCEFGVASIVGRDFQANFIDYKILYIDTVNLQITENYKIDMLPTKGVSPNDIILNQINHVFIIKRWSYRIVDVRSYRGASCSSDPGKQHLQLPSLKNPRKNRLRKFEVEKLKNATPTRRTIRFYSSEFHEEAHRMTPHIT